MFMVCLRRMHDERGSEPRSRRVGQDSLDSLSMRGKRDCGVRSGVPRQLPIPITCVVLRRAVELIIATLSGTLYG